nr:DNA double-strand break repair nuclease NurA [Candidatus Njordarchaeota archaeon]
MSTEDILKKFVGVLEDHFPEAETFQPRDIALDKFVFINDEDVDKHDELVEDEAVEFLAGLEESKPKALEPDSLSLPVSSVDASSAQIGETNLGVISAVRVAVWKQEPGKTPAIRKYGPYLAHFTRDNVDFIYNYFRHEIFGVARAEPPQVYKMTDRLRNFFERLAQRQASEIIEKGMTLFDGSLRGGTVDTPLEVLRGTINSAHGRGNCVVGISKSSTLTTSDGQKLLGMLDEYPKSCYRDVHEEILGSLKSQILGRVHVVKFTPDGFTFRVDVAPAPGKDCDKTLCLVKSNCAFFGGYPEPLRAAHIHAYFTPDEILSLQNLAVKKYDMEIVRPFDFRRCIFSPFGG